MARILRFLQQGFLYLLGANESDGENVGSGDVGDRGGAVAGSADVLEKDMGSVGDFSGPIHSIEPVDESKHVPDITGEAVEAHKQVSDALKATDEIQSPNQGRPESCGGLTPLKRSFSGGASPVPDSDVQQATKKNKRSDKWSTQETEALIICKLQPSFPKGNAGWKLISSKIPGRASEQCEQRWKTVQKSYKQIKRYCAVHSKEFSQVSNEEFLSMKLETKFFTLVQCGHWYKKIDNFFSPTTITSSANILNGASISTHPVGKTHLPSSAYPNLEGSHPELLPAAIPVEQGPSAIESTGWRQYEEAGIFTDSYLVLIKTKQQQRCEEAKPMLLNVWWIHLSFSFMVIYGRRFGSSSQG